MNFTEERNENGFTLIELLIAIVVVGILTAVAVVGVAGLTNSGKTASCQASVDAAKAASAVYYANNHSFPKTFDDLTTPVPPAPPLLDVQSSVKAAGAVMHDGTNWTVTMAGDGTTEPTFTACP